MPTVFTHAVAGIASGAAVYKKSLPKGFWLLTVICSIVPDADVICFKLGIPYSSIWGHRGFFHSIFFACILGSFVGIILMKAGKRNWKEGLFFSVYFCFVISLHGILDAFTNGGLGIALLSPFIIERYFFLFTPITVSPFSPGALLTERGFQIFKSEILWVWIPGICSAVLLRMVFSVITTIRLSYLSFRRVQE